MTRANDTAWLDRFPDLRILNDAALRKALAGSRLLDLESGDTVFRDGDACEYYILVLEGSLRVQKISSSGHEIVLYHVQPGQTCELTTTCLLARKYYPAEAIAETQARVALIPKSQFHDTLQHSAGFREFVFSSLEKGIAGLVQLVEEVAFGRMDSRLAQRLLDRRSGSEVVQATHQELANELGTAREVVSRLLKKFERHGWVDLGRGRITLTNLSVLESIARH